MLGGLWHPLRLPIKFTFGQLAKIMIMDYPDLSTKIRSIAHLDGLPFTGPFVARSVQERES